MDKLKLRADVQRKIGRCMDIFKNRFTKLNPDYPTVEYDLKGTKAGIAYYRFNKIRLNESLLIKYGQEFIDSTVVHEMAHLLVDYWYTRQPGNLGVSKPHGTEWKAMMNILGISEPKRCHSYEVERTRKQARFAYECGCDTIHMLSTTLHNKVSQGRNRICTKCRTRLSFTGKTII